MTRLLTSNAALASRMRQLDDVFGGRTLDRESLPHYTRRPLPSAASLLNAGSPDISPISADEVGPESRSRVLSPLSGYTLAGIPVLSIIPLPVTTSELYDGNELYTFAYARRVGRDLGELMQSQASQGTSRALTILLGRSSNTDGSTSSTGSSNEECAPVAVEAPATKKPRFRSIRVKNRWRASR